MLLRCAGVAMTGMAFTAGMAAGTAIGGGAVVAALLGRRLWKEKRGWRDDSSNGDSLPPLPPEPAGPVPDPLA
jgi:hypothetical protein